MLFVMLYKVILTFDSVGEILMCVQLNERFWVVLSFFLVLSVISNILQTFSDLKD